MCIKEEVFLWLKESIIRISDHTNTAEEEIASILCGISAARRDGTEGPRRGIRIIAPEVLCW